MIHREFEGLAQFGEFLEKQVVLQETAVAAVSEVSAHVLHETAVKTFGDGQKLAPLAQATQDERTALGYSPNDPLLRDGKLLRDSIEKAHTHDIAAIGSAQKIMYYHEFGYVNSRTGKSVPPRPVFKIAMIESAPKIQAVLEEAMGAALGGSVTRAIELKP
jgi:phage gpG-like protein